MMNTNDNLQELRELCSNNQEVLGMMVKLLQEINAPKDEDPMGICQCPGMTPFPATWSDCQSRRICDWTPLIPEAKYERRNQQCRRLNQLCKDNAAMVSDVLEHLQDVMNDHAGVGICLRRNGQCFPGTKGEVAEPGGIWSYFLPPSPTRTPSKSRAARASAKPKKRAKRAKPRKKPAKAKKRSRR